MTRNPELISGPHRRGFTLIETLIVCTTVGVLTISGTVTIALLMSAESRGAESLVRQTTMARLSARFRADLHATADASLDDVDGGRQNRLRLEQPDGSTITYRITQDAVERNVEGAAGRDSRERFHLPERQMHFEPSGDARIMRLVIGSPGQLIAETTAGDLQTPAIHRITIEAAIAWDLRHTLRKQGNVEE